MNTWPVQFAKSRFSELLDTCVKQGPQLVTRRGEQTAVLVPISEWKRLNYNAGPSLKALLLSKQNRGSLKQTSRGLAKRRSIPIVL